MNNLKRILGGINLQYLIRAYILGALFFALMMLVSVNAESGLADRWGFMVYFALCTLLFPFSKLVWDELKALVLGETFLILPIVFLYPAKLVVNLLLFSCALFIAPFGVIYIWIKTKS